MEVLAYIKEISPGKWRVFSEKGKNLGTFDSRKKAKKRLSQIEYFKHKGEFFNSLLKKSKSEESTTTLSAKIRDLNKNNQNAIIPFLKSFQKAFYAAVEQGIEDPEQTALLEVHYENE